jgi:hypothetical protein
VVTGVDAQLPLVPQDLTPTWLSAQLGWPVTRVDWAYLDPQGWSTQLLRLQLRTHDERAARSPTSVIAKISAHDEATRTFFGRFYAREVDFYRTVAMNSVAGRVPIVGPVQSPSPKQLAIPQCHYAAYDRRTQAHVLLLEDASPAVAGDMVAGVGAAPALEFATRIAVLHARWWEHADLPALERQFPPHGRNFAAGYDRVYAAGLSTLGGFAGPSTARLASKLSDGLTTRWNSQYLGPRTLIHWDAHAGNLMMPVDDRGPWTLLDWQNVTVGNGLFDLCRFATLSMEPDERIANEADIVGNYVSQLNRAGVTYQYAAAWARYQELLPLSFAQQLRFFAGIESWDASRIAWRDAVAPRVIAALHQALG